jgi:hypothetical protein
MMGGSANHLKTLAESGHSDSRHNNVALAFGRPVGFG